MLNPIVLPPRRSPPGKGIPFGYGVNVYLLLPQVFPNPRRPAKLDVSTPLPTYSSRLTENPKLLFGEQGLFHHPLDLLPALEFGGDSGAKRQILSQNSA